MWTVIINIFCDKMFGSMCAEERKEMETAKARAIGRVEKVVVHNLTISFCLKVRVYNITKKL